MQQLTGMQALKAIGAWALIATVVPLLGVLLIPVVVLGSAGRALAAGGGTVVRTMRPVAQRALGVTAPTNVYGWLR